MQQPTPEALKHHPNIKDDKEAGGLFCFLNIARPCQADCMAWVARPDGADYKDNQWANCLLLVNAHRTGKHLVVLASVASDLKKATDVATADQKRTNQPPPPTVR